MGILVPDDFPMSSLANEAERAVVQALVERLSDGWLVLPDVGIAGMRDRQIDIVLAHEQEGVAVVEVKGHQVWLDRGLFKSERGPLDPQPHQQASGNAYALRDVLRARPELAGLRVEYAIAFPNTVAATGQLPPDLTAAQVLTGAALEDPAAAIDRLMSARWGNQRLGTDGLRAIVDVLRPSAELEWDADAQARRARRRLQALCRDQTQALEPLDLNRRVLITGGAGSGKTRLAMAWARRSLGRGEHVMLTCYNDPLADAISGHFDDHDRLTVGAFYRAVLQLDGMPELTVPDDATGAWWDTIAVGHLHSNWRHITDRFDTVIIDEAQDFSAAWLAQLEQLLDPTEPRRMMLLADATQVVYERGFRLPAADDGWTRCDLTNNCRNTFAIATMLQRLGGTSAPVAGPETMDVGWTPISDLESALTAVGDEIDRIEAAGHHAPSILIATTTRAVRDQLRERYALGRWEERDEHTIICETVHRVKGLEFDFVVLVVTSDEISDLLLYVGASRAIVGFSLVGPESVADRLGIRRQARRADVALGAAERGAE